MNVHDSYQTFNLNIIQRVLLHLKVVVKIVNPRGAQKFKQIHAYVRHLNIQTLPRVL